MARHRACERADERFPVVEIARRVVPRVAVGASSGRPGRGVGDVGPQRDAVLRREIREPMQPGEIVTATFRLVVVPAETATPGGDAELVEQREIPRHLGEVVALVVILENREAERLGRSDRGGRPTRSERAAADLDSRHRKQNGRARPGD
jgi:hypothetical protein